MDIELFNYNLPPERIAQSPVRPRERAKMLYYDQTKDQLRDHHVADLPSLVRAGDLLVFNKTKVRHARLHGTWIMKHEAQETEILVLKPLEEEGTFECLLKGKNIQIGEQIALPHNIALTVVDRITDPAMGRYVVKVEGMSSTEFLDFCEERGQLPLPPYIHNPQIEGFEDELYQPITAKELGSVAAPTASLHFSEKLLEEITIKGIKTAEVLLHVGLGTFIPVRVADTKDHVMHSEEIAVSAEVLRKIKETKTSGGRVIAVGTTVARALESVAERLTAVEAFSLEGAEAFKGEANLFIQPGYEFSVIDGLLTNFHLPKSTLLMMVSALTGREKLFELYDHALNTNYRFLSFGDCMLLI